jgi:hypothetical protein
VNPDREITPLVAEFERFIEDGYLDYLQLLLRVAEGRRPEQAGGCAAQWPADVGERRASL